jgi:Mlc titration factor MtfA (ptsG expression regulator)
MELQLDRFYLQQSVRQLRNAILIMGVVFLIFGLAGTFIAENPRQTLFLHLLGFFLGILAFFTLSKRARQWLGTLHKPFPENYRDLLEKHVDFYRNLEPQGRKYFEQRVAHFLKTRQITPVGCTIDDKLRLFIAAGAIMPVFSFPEFCYPNIREILVYPDSFDEEYHFSTPAEKKRIAGMVGNGPMNRMMILSKKDLLKAFDDTIDAENLVIHEFVHLIDMADGAVDGVPKALMEKRYALPWVREIHREMHRIRRHQSDIDNYSLTNDAEFLAVVSEYFFDTPDKFRDKHPGLYEMLSRIFRYGNRRFHR